MSKISMLAASALVAALAVPAVVNAEPVEAWMMVVAATLLATACEKQAPVNSAPPEEITAPAPAANPQPDVNAEPVEAPTFKAEKCYGVVKAGKNDCQTNNSSCAGTSRRDGQADAWIYVPAGSCERIVGGSVSPKA